MTDYAALKAEIIKPAYVGMTDVQIAAAVNALTITVKRNIESTKAMNALLFTAIGDWGNVVSVADGVVTQGVAAANRTRCISIKELFTRNYSFDTSDDTRWTRFIATVDALVTDARMSAEGKTLLVALGRPVVNFAASIGWPGGVGDGDVAAARNLP